MGKGGNNIANYKGVEGGVDEFTTRKLYNYLARQQPMNAVALHTIITDGAWYPERANKRGNNDDGLCLICKCGKKGGLQHIWWECEA
eukprot:4859620-Heterocapsa_arctica.AAC.1